MRGVNNVILIGNATRDAEPRHIQTGKPASNIHLATSRADLNVGEEEGDSARGEIGHSPLQTLGWT
jgi:single-stranded DNA-binding protein